MYLPNKDETVSTFRFIRNGNSLAYFRDSSEVIITKSIYENGGFDSSIDTIEHYKWLQPGSPTISEEDACNTAMKYINRMGIDLKLYSTEPCTIISDYVKKDTGWSFTFTRCVSGLQSQFYDGDWSFVDPNVRPVAGAPWEQETCIILIDQDGLCKFWWQGASIVSNITASGIELEEFNSVKNKIANTITDIYRSDKNGMNSGLDIVITKIELGTSLITAADQNGGGEYIPTWYISFIYKWSNESDIEENWCSQRLAFNAINGDYIEPRILTETILSM